MPLSSQQKRYLYLTMPIVMTSKHQMADLFYMHLFAAMPDSRDLFQNNLSDQKHKFMSLLARAVRALDDPEEFREMIRGLSERHVRYGATPEHFSYTGEVLIKSVGDVLGERFTPQVEDAWRALYDEISNSFIDAADIN